MKNAFLLILFIGGCFQMNWANNIPTIDKATADQYIANYKKWSDERVNTIARGFNLNKETCDAINQLMSEGSYPGVRTYYGLTKEIAMNEWPADELVVMLVYPVDAEGHQMQTSSQQVYVTDVADGFTRPCPEWCD